VKVRKQARGNGGGGGREGEGERGPWKELSFLGDNGDQRRRDPKHKEEEEEMSTARNRIKRREKLQQGKLVLSSHGKLVFKSKSERDTKYKKKGSREKILNKAYYS